MTHSALVVLIVLLVLVAFFYAPREGYVTPGYAPFSIGGLLVLLLILYLLGVIRV